MLTRPNSDGTHETLSAAEEAEIRAEWAANELKSTEDQRLKGIKDAADVRIALMIPGAIPPTDKLKVLEREMNIMLANADLDDIVINGGVLTPEQIAQKAFFRTLKTKIVKVRELYATAKAGTTTVDEFIAQMDLAGL